MHTRTLVLLVLSCLSKVVPTATPIPAETDTPPPPPMAPTATPTPEPPSPTPSATATPMPPSPTPSPTASPTPEGRPELLVPPDGLTAQLFDLMWAWDGRLGASQWFEVRIWPDEPGDQPVSYFWTQERTLRVTSAMLLPGAYRWQVVVVSGDGESPGDALYPESLERTFIMSRPHTLARMSVTPPQVPTRTPSPTPTPTRTWRPWPTATYTPEITETIPPEPTSTATSTPEPTIPPEPTSTSTTEPTIPTEPTATSTTEPTVPLEPTATSTPEPPPTATATTYP